MIGSSQGKFVLSAIGKKHLIFYFHHSRRIRYLCGEQIYPEQLVFRKRLNPHGFTCYLDPKIYLIRENYHGIFK